jgi:two-component system, cell cycle response regulator
MEDKDIEVLELRRRVARLKEEARKNEDAWKRSQAREMELLEADTLAELLDRATEGLRQSYQLEAVTLVLVDHDHEMRHLLMSQGGTPDDLTAVQFVDSLRGIVPPTSPRPRPWLGPFAEQEHAPLFRRDITLASVALLPLSRQQRLFGSLNMGSTDPRRFTQRHATDFLNHLAVIAAFSLENTVNRARLVRSGFTDALTGWHNRRYLEARLKEELARSARDAAPLTCLMADVDHFKRVNDEHGHLAGDDVLSQVARRIDAQVRSSDVSARYGGEEFIILLPGTDAQAGRALAERIRRAVSATPFRLSNGRALPVTVSIGVAEHAVAGHERGADTAAAGERLISRADRALYDAKAGGRNLVAVADED